MIRSGKKGEGQNVGKFIIRAEDLRSLDGLGKAGEEMDEPNGSTPATPFLWTLTVPTLPQR